MAGEYDVQMAAELNADGLRAQCDSLVVSPWDRDAFVTLLDGLAAHFHGWTGPRTWRTNRFSLEAVFHSGGHVQLTWALTPTMIDPLWRVAMTTWIEAGEQMSALAADARSFLTRPEPRVDGQGQVTSIS